MFSRKLFYLSLIGCISLIFLAGHAYACVSFTSHADCAVFTINSSYYLEQAERVKADAQQKLLAMSICVFLVVLIFVAAFIYIKKRKIYNLEKQGEFIMMKKYFEMFSTSFLTGLGVILGGGIGFMLLWLPFILFDIY